MKLIVAPPGSGKTTYLMNLAIEACKNKKRVWWVGLPNHRSYIYHLASQHGAILGFEFLLQQQIYYRLLTRAMKLKSLLVGTGRIARVGDALSLIQKSPASPGEARLFTRAIAELKRYGLSYKDIEIIDTETHRIRDVFKAYERIKKDEWDYDDFRQATLELVKTGTPKAEADLIIVDGYREISTLDLEIYQELSKSKSYSSNDNLEIWLSLPETPAKFTADIILEEKYPVKVNTYKAANPISEARWVLRSLKQDLANGASMLELAVILPQNRTKAFLALADEYGLALVDESPKALTDTIAGSLVMDLLEIPNYPTASKLLAIPELIPLARVAMQRKIAGLSALELLAKELNLLGTWNHWLNMLNLDDETDELKWANNLLELIELNLNKNIDTDFNWQNFKKHALERAKEASKLASGASFRAWWAALLQDSYVFKPAKAGIPILNHNLASGRRFKKSYILSANEGNYSLREQEDYFIPEEQRVVLENIYKSKKLPKRYLGRDQLLYDELLASADEVVITYPEADQGGPLVVESSLVGSNAAELPIIAAGSRLELNQNNSFKANISALELKPISLEKLKNYQACPFRYWANSAAKPESFLPDWLELLNQMRNYKSLNPARLDNLKSSFPNYASWLNEYSDSLSKLRYGKSIPEKQELQSYIDAAAQYGKTTSLYRFVAPELVNNQAEAKEYIERRWNELWASAYLLENYKQQIDSVKIYIWPISGQKIEVYDGAINYIWKKMKLRQNKAKAAFREYKTGNVEPKPGFICRECNVYDICREGQR